MDTGDVVKSATVTIQVANLGLEEDADRDGAAEALHRMVRSFIADSACPEWQNAVGDNIDVAVYDMDSSIRTKLVAFTVRYQATVKDDGMDDLREWARRNAWAIVLDDQTDIDVEVDVDYDDVTDDDDYPTYRVSGGDLDDRLLELLKALQASNQQVWDLEAKLRVEQEALARALDDAPGEAAKVAAMLQGSVPETVDEIADTVHSEMAADQDHGDA